jgi:Rrf2 family protein
MKCNINRTILSILFDFFDLFTYVTATYDHDFRKFHHTKETSIVPVMFSRACEYAIRVLSVMAGEPERRSWQIHDLAAKTGTPAAFLSKIFQMLTKANVLNSTKGRGGGFSFERPVDEIFLTNIIEAIDGNSLFEECVLGLPECGGDAPCPFHDDWTEIRETIVRALSQKSLADLAVVPGEVLKK